MQDMIVLSSHSQGTPKNSARIATAMFVILKLLNVPNGRIIIAKQILTSSGIDNASKLET